CLHGVGRQSRADHRQAECAVQKACRCAVIVVAADEQRNRWQSRSRSSSIHGRDQSAVPVTAEVRTAALVANSQAATVKHVGLIEVLDESTAQRYSYSVACAATSATIQQNA